jgi:hypothetical protein
LPFTTIGFVASIFCPFARVSFGSFSPASAIAPTTNAFGRLDPSAEMKRTQ